MKKLLCTVAFVGTLVAPGLVRAQATVGPVLAYHDDADALGVGGYAGISVPSLDEHLTINPSFIYYFPDAGSFWEINGDVVYAFEVAPDTPVLPFALAGLNIAHSSVDVPVLGSVSDTDVGLNLGGGVGFRAQSLQPFAGAKFEIHSTQFVLFGGIGFSVGP